MDREDEVREIAHQLWEKEGHPEGRRAEHWVRAEAIWQERHRPPAPAKPSAPPAPAERTKKGSVLRKKGR